MNKYTGDVDFDIHGNKYTLNLNWGAVAEVQSKYGATAIQDLFNALKVGNTPDMETLSGIIAIAMKKHHPQIDVEKVKELSPPIVSSITVLNALVEMAYFGGEVPEEVEEENGKKGGKKTK